MRSFAGKVALVTGASTGIGEAACRLLADEQLSHLVLADIQREKAQALLDELQKSHGLTGVALSVDVASESDVSAMFAAVEERFGKLDVLVNSAGIAKVGPVETLELASWQRTLDVNLTGTFLCSQGAFKIMKRERGGKIINIASMAARVGGVSAGADYVASKGGVIALTKSLAKQGAAHSIYANAIAPGFISTPLLKAVGGYDAKLVPLQRFGEPHEVASVIAFLASEEASFITGATIDVNGGMYLA